MTESTTKGELFHKRNAKRVKKKWKQEGLWSYASVSQTSGAETY